jgi:hypothetical protein
MDTLDLLKLKHWFSAYCRRFYPPDEKGMKNIALKELHTHRVCENMAVIARSVFQNNTKILLAEAIGLLHDIGRFPQYARYGTFRDGASVNHGKLGAEVIEEEHILSGLPFTEQEVIVDAVRFHNAFAVPDHLDPEKIFFLKMIRDADKLDIWRVFSEYYEKEQAERESAVGLDLPDRPDYSEAIVACLAEKRLSSLSGLKTLNDFMLLLLTWVYDLNFPASFRLASDRGHISRIIARLPGDERIQEAVSALEDYLRDKTARRKAMH